MRRGRIAAGIVLLVLLGLAVGAAYVGWRRPPSQASTDPQSLAPGERVRVEVLNAGGVSGQARAATGRLRAVGFDVVQWGNARSFDRDSSVVIDRVERVDLARAVANALGIGNVLSEPDPNLFVDVTVLLGREWSAKALEGVQSEATPRRAPWDPRGWLGR